eukprot:gene26232-47486_t
MLSSGRAAILGYTMSVFSALLGVAFFGARIRLVQWLGVAAASVGVLLLLLNELTNLSGRPLGVLMALSAAAVWALGTQKLRATTIATSTLTLSFWMTLMAAVVLTVLCILFESSQWRLPQARNWVAIAYNGILIFGFTHAAWFTLARGLPPVASTLSTMMIPVLGVFLGALWLGEVLHWQDWAAVALMAVAISTTQIVPGLGFVQRVAQQVGRVQCDNCVDDGFGAMQTVNLPAQCGQWLGRCQHGRSRQDVLLTASDDR